MGLPTIDYLDVWVSARSTKKSSGRGASKARSNVGYESLRELILRAALSGKITSQNHVEHVSSGIRISNRKFLESPFEIPDNWVWVFLPDIAEYNTGRTPSTKNPKYWTSDSEGFHWVSIADLNNKGFVETTAKRVSTESKNEIFKSGPVKAGTILMSFKLTVGKTSILNVDAYHNEAIISLQPKQCISHKYLFQLLPVMSQWGNTKDAIKGKTLNLKSIARIPVPLPPMEEQKRIVAKVDELMGLIDDLEAQTETVQESHSELVDALLRILVESEDADGLAKNWKTLSKHFDTLFTTEQSVEKLKATILDLGVNGKLTQSQILRTSRLDDVFDTLDGDRGKNYPKKSDYKPEGYCLFLSTKNVRKNGFLFDDLQFISREKDLELRQGKLKRGDLVITTRGTLGNVAFYDINIPHDNIRINSGMLILRQKSTDITQKFMKLFIQSPSFFTQLEAKRSGTAQQQIPAGILKTFTIPVFTKESQNNIINKIDELMALCGSLLEHTRESEGLKVELAKSVVHHASAN